jgi:hypothetical protein
MIGKAIGPTLGRAVVVVALTAASLGIAAAPAAAKPKVCKIYFQGFRFVQAEFIKAYNNWDQSSMDFWLHEYENLIEAAEAAGC